MLFKSKKTIISNPDEVILNYMEHPDQKHIKALNKADINMLFNVLSHFDIQTVCKVLGILSPEKSKQVFEQFSEKRQSEIVKRLPSQAAAMFLKEALHRA